MSWEYDPATLGRPFSTPSTHLEQGSSSPEQESSAIFTPKQAQEEQAPPNVTITSRGGLPSCRAQNSPELYRPSVQGTELFRAGQGEQPGYQLRVLQDTTDTADRKVSRWFERNDSALSSFNNSPVATLLQDPEIVNNQSNSLTKALYAMKGFAQDFRDLRLKSGYGEEEVSRSLVLVYGKEFNPKLVSDFEKLLLPLHTFLRVKPAMEKWITSVRPNDVVAPCPDWSLPIEIAREKRRKRSSSEEEDRERRRLRKRTKIDSGSKRELEAAFLLEPKPSTAELSELASRTKLDRDVVRVWFANRRQKQKRQPGSQLDSKDSPPTWLDNNGRDSDNEDQILFPNGNLQLDRPDIRLEELDRSDTLDTADTGDLDTFMLALL